MGYSQHWFFISHMSGSCGEQKSPPPRWPFLSLASHLLSFLPIQSYAGLFNSKPLEINGFRLSGFHWKRTVKLSMFLREKTPMVSSPAGENFSDYLFYPKKGAIRIALRNKLGACNIFQNSFIVTVLPQHFKLNFFFKGQIAALEL